MANITDIERLNYYEGEFLGALDFQTEQEYHRDMRRRHNLGQHAWGIVSGLELVQVPNGGTTPPPGSLPTVDIYLQPGVAVDAFGREIVVLNKTQLTQDLFASYGNLVGTQEMFIWISYAQLMLQPPADVCTQVNQPNAFGRFQEAFALTVTQDPVGPTGTPIVVDGKAVAPPAQTGDIVFPPDDSIPYQEFSADDSTVNWYVPLGRVFWDATNGGVFVQQTKDKLDDSWLAVGRQYAGIVASEIYAPPASTVYAPAATKDYTPYYTAPGLTLKDRFAPYPLPADPNGPNGQFYGGVGVEIAGSLLVDRLLEAQQNVLIDGAPDLTPIPTKNKKPGLSPLTINASPSDQSFIQFRDSSGPQFSIWETQANTNINPPVPAGLNFGEADSSGKPATSDLLIQGGNVHVDPGNHNPGSSLTPGLAFGSNSTEGIASNAGGLDFYTAGKPRLSITNGGQASFQGALSINHAGVTGVGSPGDQRAAITFGATDTPSAFYFGTYDGNSAKATTILGLFSYQLGKWIQYWTPNGNVGIGTVSPSHQLEIVDTTNTGLRVQTNIAGGTVASFGGFGDFQIDAPGVVGGRVIVKENGNVGIGTTAPSAQLEVAGTVKFGGKSLVQIYRLYNSTNGDHFYTPSATERDNAVANDGYVDETPAQPNFFAFV